LLVLDAADTQLLCLYAAADDSGSMAFEENGERVEDLKMIGSKVRQGCCCCDT
jgi:hypothetical protein